MHGMSELKLSKKWDHMKLLRCVLKANKESSRSIGGSAFHNRIILLKYE